MYKRIIIVMVLLCMTAVAANAQDATPSITLADVVTEADCVQFLASDEVEATQTQEAEGITAGGPDDLMAQTRRPGHDLDGPFRALGGQNPYRDYRRELRVVVDAEGDFVDDPDFDGFVLDAAGNVINEPDYGGSLGFYSNDVVCAETPNGVWLIAMEKGLQEENLPGTAKVIPPNSMLFWDDSGGHAFAYAGADVDQIIIELSKYFGPFSAEELKAEKERVVAIMQSVNSVLSLDLPANARDQ